MASVPLEPEQIHARRRKHLEKKREASRNPQIDAELDIDPIEDAEAGDEDLKANIWFEEDSEDGDAGDEKIVEVEKPQSPQEYLAVLSTWGVIDRFFLVLFLVVLTARALRYHDQSSSSVSEDLRNSLLIFPTTRTECFANKFQRCPTREERGEFFSDISTREQFWGWLDTSLLPMLYHGNAEDRGQTLTFGYDLDRGHYQY
eukprot:2159603-Rhodomonas_salina.2